MIGDIEIITLNEYKKMLLPNLYPVVTTKLSKIDKDINSEYNITLNLSQRRVGSCDAIVIISPLKDDYFGFKVNFTNFSHSIFFIYKVDEYVFYEFKDKLIDYIDQFKLLFNKGVKFEDIFKLISTIQ